MRWHWASASVAGSSHRRAGQPLQDAHVCRQLPGGVWAAVLSDGAGSARHGGAGAALACRHLMQAVRRHGGLGAQAGVALPDGGLPSDDLCRQWLAQLRDRLVGVASRRGLAARDFACTLVMAISTGTQTLVLHVGDGGAVARCADTGRWQVLSWPQHGEYASTTAFVTDPAAALRISRLDAAIDGLVLFSDGLERQVLDWAAHTAFSPFFTAMAAPLLAVAPAIDVARADDAFAGRLPGLCRQLAQYLGSPAVTARTDDDTTLVVAVRT